MNSSQFTLLIFTTLVTVVTARHLESREERCWQRIKDAMTHYEKSHCVAGVHQEFFNNMVRSFCPGWFGEGAGLSETNCSEERVDLNFPPPDGRATYSTRRKFIYRVNNQRELERIANPTFREEAAAKTF